MQYCTFVYRQNFNVRCVYAAYTLEEVDEKTKPFRASVNFAVGDKASSLDVSMALILNVETFMFWGFRLVYVKGDITLPPLTFAP